MISLIEKIAIQRAQEQSDRSFDPGIQLGGRGVLEVDESRYPLPIYKMCRWCGHRMRCTSDACGKCKFIQKPCTVCSGPIRMTRLLDRDMIECRKCWIAMRKKGVDWPPRKPGESVW